VRDNRPAMADDTNSMRDLPGSLPVVEENAHDPRIEREVLASADALLPVAECDRLRTRWEEIQTGFVDDPHRTFEQADDLVAEVMRRLAERFATDDLPAALARYRAFFQRVLMA
jgi:hypothetical protein